MVGASRSGQIIHHLFFLGGFGVLFQVSMVPTGGSVADAIFDSVAGSEARVVDLCSVFGDFCHLVDGFH